MSFRRMIRRQVEEITKSQVKINRTKRDVNPKKRFFDKSKKSIGVVPVAKQMHTCISLLVAGVDRTRYDIINKEARLADTTGTQSTVHGTTTGSRTGSPTNHRQHQTGVHIFG